MANNLFIFIVALFMVIESASLATTYAARLAKSFHLSRYAIGFIVVTIISILPETFIAINSAINGVPSFGLGMLFGANIADLTLVFAIIIFVAGRGVRVESAILKNHAVYPFVLLLPLVLGFDGYFSRFEGAALIIAGMTFYYIALRSGASHSIAPSDEPDRYKNFLLFLFSMVILLAGAHFTVTSATALANLLAVNPILIGMLVVGLGTTMPELFFSLKSVKKHADSLAIGDILGTVLANATVVVGILALIHPFFFPQKIIYITGVFMVVASFLLFYFMNSGRMLTKKEAYLLFAFWLMFVVVEFFASA
ncbi:MAG: sodium:calcium antiporter [Parcubacteria group bacterium]|nr:sodium:calcium antiporter [Parcubacteria group bacterium]